MSLRDSQVPNEQSLSRACRGDAELMKKAANGDTEAFVCLYISLVAALRHFFTKHGADRELCNELVQRVLFYLWATRADLCADTSFEKYLFRIARNILNKEMRRPRRREELDLEDLPQNNDDSNHALSEPEAVLYMRGAKKADVSKLDNRAWLKANQQSRTELCV